MSDILFSVQYIRYCPINDCLILQIAHKVDHFNASFLTVVSMLFILYNENLLLTWSTLF